MENDERGKVIPFPRQLRIVPNGPPERSDKMAAETLATLIDHDGRVYDIADLIRHLSPAELREVGSTAPRSPQELWDEVVRRWPAWAAEIVAGNQAVD